MRQTHPLNKLFAWTHHVQSRRPRRHPKHLWRRRSLSALLLLTAIIAATIAWQYYSADQRIQALAINAVARLSGGEVEIDNAQLHVLRQIRIQGFRLYLPDRPHTPENLVLGAEDVILEHHFLSLFRRRLDLNRVVATDRKSTRLNSSHSC